jgi:hypothetical protein
MNELNITVGFSKAQNGTSAAASSSVPSLKEYSDFSPDENSKRLEVVVAAIVGILFFIGLTLFVFAYSKKKKEDYVSRLPKTPTNTPTSIVVASSPLSKTSPVSPSSPLPPHPRLSEIIPLK